jgi:hypothetical protein
MNAINIDKQFARMGARMKIRLVPLHPWRQTDYAIDIQRDQQGEFFELRVPENQAEEVEFTVMQAEPRRRHLLMLARRTGEQKRLDRFLCGHDERHWFVAAVPGGASSVAQAMEALKPSAVREAQARKSLNGSQRNRRNNGAFRRQGEWFFIPEPTLQVAPELVLRNEPIRRGRGKAHLVQFLHRSGGELVYVNSRYPNGLNEADYKNLLNQNPAAANWGWRRMVRNASVYARGEVRHPDHAVITLPCWHRVLMNTENESRAMEQVAFLD